MRTRYPRDLYTRTDGTWTFAYDPAVGDQIKQMININDEITVKWRDGTTEAIWACLRQATFGELADGTMPTISAVISPTNTDNAIAEQESVIASVSGT